MSSGTQRERQTDPIRSPEMRERWEFGLLCNVRGLMYGTAVEVGTDRGDFAVSFLESWRGPLLRCVDPWKRYPEMPDDREADYQMAISRLAPFGTRVRILRMDSLTAVPKVPDPIVFVYIDAYHAVKAVLADCRAWWPRLAPEGILAGHDINKPRVRKAMLVFANEVERDLYCIGSKTSEPSWYLYKDVRTKPFPWRIGGWTGRRYER